MNHNSIASQLFEAIRIHRTGIVAILLLVTLVTPPVAQGQFGFDIGPIVAAIHSIGTAISAVVVPALKAVNKGVDLLQKVLDKLQVFLNENIFPLDAIGRAQGIVSAVETMYGGIRSIATMKVASATLPMPQSLEGLLLSRDPSQIPNIGQAFGNVYQTVPVAQDAPQETRDLIDTMDAAAEDAMKKAVAIDANADTEQDAVSKINAELQAAAPGTAPMVEAVAAAWLVRANAFSQSAQAEVIRVRAIQLARDSAQLKINALHAAQLRQSTQGALK